MRPSITPPLAMGAPTGAPQPRSLDEPHLGAHRRRGPLELHDRLAATPPPERGPRHLAPGHVALSLGDPQHPSQPVSRAGSTTNSARPSASETITVSSWPPLSAADLAPDFLSVAPADFSSRTASSAEKPSAVIPRYKVSNSETAPRITGQPSGFTRCVIERNGRSMEPRVPSGRRTDTAMRDG